MVRVENFLELYVLNPWRPLWIFLKGKHQILRLLQVHQNSEMICYKCQPSQIKCFCADVKMYAIDMARG